MMVVEITGEDNKTRKTNKSSAVLGYTCIYIFPTGKQRRIIVEAFCTKCSVTRNNFTERIFGRIIYRL